MKLSVSGWPGGGSSALSLILCKMLGVKYIYGSNTFRYLYKTLSFGDSGEGRVDAHNYIEPYFGPVYDKYIDLVITKEDNFLIESDIAAFRVGKQKGFFSIFLITDQEVRKERMGKDNRSDDAETIESVDESHKEMYSKLHGIRWFDLDQIKETHAFVLDNNKLSIAEELQAIFQEMHAQGLIDQEQMTDLVQRSEAEEKEFWENGKKYYQEYLKEHGQVMSVDEILHEISSKFSDEVNEMPEELKSLIK
ncbi:hypothetical protein KC669_03975 [Candidatus Dojkabacteria bacterium]|uniref:Cytidylate kinase-like family protein n=1 Tax=Candidatus Dojkabacteria bacterium TaxID=2099670 RepID=A0A955LBJ6_9BACT|nr:hypothetical protein [Candidatus Dojkabacteria bacterium]